MAKITEITMSEAREMVRGAGLRGTSCRLSVLQYLSAATTPLSHAEVAEELDSHGYDKSTIYRSLVELAEAGLLSRFDVGDHTWRFEFRRGEAHDEGTEHPHFMCVTCGKVTCLDDVDIKLKASNKKTYSDITEVLLKGHCRECG